MFKAVAFVFSVSCLMPLPLFSADASAPSVRLPDVVALAKEKNPEIQAALRAWKVSQANIVPAGAWPNPMLSYVDEKFPSMDDGQAVKHYRVQQSVPFPGKLSRDAQMKRHETLIAEANYRSKELEVIGDVRMKYYALYLTDQKIDLALKTVDSLKSVLKTAQSRLASAQSTTSDVFMAQIELRKMENMLFEQQQQRRLIEIELNALLNQPADRSWGATSPIELADLPATLSEFEKVARDQDPEFWAAMHETNHAKTMSARNRLEWAPDFDFMYERETSPGLNAGRQIGIGVSFPLWLQRTRALNRASAEHVHEAEARAQSMGNMVLKMVHEEFTECKTHLALAQNYERDILPLAQSNLKIAREQYASGRGDFLRILEAFRAWIEAHYEYQEQVYHYGEHWSLLERWVGVDLNQAKAFASEQGTKENHHAH